MNAIHPSTGPEWHARRLQNVGGSEVAALFFCQPDYAMSLYTLWMVKAGRVPPPEVSGPRPEWGLRLEEAIAFAAAEQEGWTISKGGHVVAPTVPGMSCTLDYVIDAAEGEEGPGCLEVKNVDWMVHKRQWLNAEPPIHILLQHQHQLACTGYVWGAVVCLVGGNDLRIYRYRARPKIIADIRRRVEAFWQSIRDNKPPAPDGSDGASAVLRALYAEPADDEADLTTDNELPEICANFQSARSARMEAEKDEKLWRNRLIGKLGPHLRAKTQGYRISTAVTQEKPDREAMPGEIIKGRAESRRYAVKEWVE